jgi:hypothetical protein
MIKAGAKIKTAVVVCLLSMGAGLCSSAFADGSVPVKGFLTGNDFLRFDSVQQILVVETMLDGFDFTAYIGANDHLVKNLNACTDGMTGGQATAVVKKYLNDNPVRWDWQLSNLVFDAMKDACKDRGYRLP